MKPGEYEKLIINCGETAFSIISFIKNTRNKYNIPFKDKLILHIDMLSKELEMRDIQVCRWEGNISKSNMGNLSKIEYDLYELFKNDIFFDYINIDGYNVYLELPTIEKKLQLNLYINVIKRLEGQKIKYQNKLSNKNFVLKAQTHIVEAEQKKLTDTENKIQSLKSIILMFNCGKEHYDLLVELGNHEQISWEIQYGRELQSKIEKYEPEWFDEIYNEQINEDEIKLLHRKFF